MMATNPDNLDMDTDVDDDIIDVEEGDDQQHEEGGEDDGGDADETEDLIFTDTADEPDEANTPPWAKHLRQENARISKENRELKRAAESRVVEEADIVVGPRPGIYDEGIDGDEERFNAALDEWEGQKEAAAQQKQRREQAQKQQQDEWSKVERRYTEGLAKLNVPGKQEAVDAAFAELSGAQKAVILKHADDPARFFAALGKNPAKLAQIVSIEDPFALTKAMTKMEAMLKQTKGPRPPEPTRQVRGTPMATGDKQLERLEAAAAKSGDRSALIAYKASLAEKKGK